MTTSKEDNDTKDAELKKKKERSMRVLLTGYFNGYSVEVRSTEEISLLYHMGCFGNNSTRSRRKLPSVPVIMRQRQFNKRCYWHKKFAVPEDNSEVNSFLKEVQELSAKITKDCTEVPKDVIDLVSSDEDVEEGPSEYVRPVHSDNDEVVVIVPNSDSEGEDYFQNLKPRCSVNKVAVKQKLYLTLQEAFFLMYGLGCLQILDYEEKVLTADQSWKLFTDTESNFIYKYVVYHYFRSKGYIVKPGLKFGGDYLLYRDGPGINHADYIVVIKSSEHANIYSWKSLLGHMRMAGTTVKEIIVAEVVDGTNLMQENTYKELSNYRVRETLLSKNIPISINEDKDYNKLLFYIHYNKL